MSDEATNEEIPYSSIHLSVGKDDAALTAMSYGVRLHIEITSKDLEGTDDGATEIRLQFQGFLDAMDHEPEAMQAFEDWLMRPCLPHIQYLLSHDRRTVNSSLQDYYDPTTLVFILKNVSGRLEATRIPEDPSMLRYLTPRVSVLDQTVSSAIQRGITCIAASQVLITRATDMSDWEYNDVPTLVQTAGEGGQQFYFKAASERGSFVRELDILMRMKHNSRDVNVTRLSALVRWEDDLSIAGFLLEYIPQAKMLDWAMEDSTLDDRTRWLAELRHTVRQLHDLHIVWGDVKPENVLIDLEGHAWVIDFGGGYSKFWVDSKLKGTMEGDSQGLDSLARYLSLSDGAASLHLLRTGEDKGFRV